MFGTIDVAEIPKLLYGFLIGIVLFGIFLGILMAFPALTHRLPEWVLTVIVLLIIWASIAGGEYIWERMDR